MPGHSRRGGGSAAPPRALSRPYKGGGGSGLLPEPVQLGLVGSFLRVSRHNPAMPLPRVPLLAVLLLGLLLRAAAAESVSAPGDSGERGGSARQRGTPGGRG